MVISFPSNTKEIIDDIRNTIGRNISFQTEIKTLCSGCFLDPVTDESSNPFCPVCNGLGYLITPSGTTVLSLVSWGPFTNLNMVPGGQFYTGICGCQIEYSDDNFNLVKSSKYLIVDGTNLKVKNFIRRGTGVINRILIDTEEL